MSREKDIQELCKQVINLEAEFSPANDFIGRPEEFDCLFCSESIDEIEAKKMGINFYDNVVMHYIKHKTNCAYLIAKDLSTNKRKNEY